MSTHSKSGFAPKSADDAERNFRHETTMLFLDHRLQLERSERQHEREKERSSFTEAVHFSRATVVALIGAAAVVSAAVMGAVMGTAVLQTRERLEIATERADQAARDVHRLKEIIAKFRADEANLSAAEARARVVDVTDEEAGNVDPKLASKHYWADETVQYHRAKLKRTVRLADPLPVKSTDSRK